MDLLRPALPYLATMLLVGPVQLDLPGAALYLPSTRNPLRMLPLGLAVPGLLLGTKSVGEMDPRPENHHHVLVQP